MPRAPRGSSDPRRASDLLDTLADIRRAWRIAPLPRHERVALFLAYGAGWRTREIADYLGAPRRTVSEWMSRGVGRIVRVLAGGSGEDEGE